MRLVVTIWVASVRVLALVAVVLATAYGPERYDGPLDVPGKDNSLPKEIDFTGAAGRSLRCDHEYYLGHLGADERFPIAESPRAALQGYAEHEFGSVPITGFELARKDDERALFVYDVDGETKAAVVVAAAIPGRWTMEVVASCDPAEFAPSADAEVGFEIWTDRDGNRVPIHELMISRRLPDHCGRESASLITFDTRTKKGTDYLRDPDGVLTDWTRGSYTSDVELPADADDTGYRLDDWQLWYAADRSAVYIVTPDAVERWPRAKQRIACM